MQKQKLEMRICLVNVFETLKRIENKNIVFFKIIKNLQFFSWLDILYNSITHYSQFYHSLF